MTSDSIVMRSAIQPVVELLEAGFVPILHGDCVLDDAQGCAILSGDKIIEVNQPCKCLLQTNHC